MLNLFLEGALLILSLVTLLWLLSVAIKNASIVDIFWGMGFVFLNFYYFFTSEDFYTRQIILLALVTLWGLRLSIFLAWRNIGKGEDFRYQEFKKKVWTRKILVVQLFPSFLASG